MTIDVPILAFKVSISFCSFLSPLFFPTPQFETGEAAFLMENDKLNLEWQHAVEATVENWEYCKGRYESYFADCSENERVFFPCRMALASWNIQVDFQNLQKDYEENPFRRGTQPELMMSMNCCECEQDLEFEGDYYTKNSPSSSASGFANDLLSQKQAKKSPAQLAACGALRSQIFPGDPQILFILLD